MSGIVNIHGRKYKTVALRVSEFVEQHKDWAIETDIISQDEVAVIMKATIKDEEGRIRGTGYAEENRSSSNINRTSALENCETSAIGRALASIGLAGTEYASANEVSGAIIEQKVLEAVQPLIEHNNAVRRHFVSISAIKGGIATGDYGTAKESWDKLTDEQKTVIWLAPSKGGVFTTNEREIIKTSEFREGQRVSNE